MKKLFVATAIALLAVGSADAKPYDVDYAKSSVEFAGQHTGQDFSGKFGVWSATINFDADNLDSSSIKASLTTASAVTGNKMYDGTLPNEDWFDSAKFQTADFVSTLITSQGEGKYTADGTLTIRGISKPAKIVFALSDLNQTPVTVKGGLVIQRLDYDIGKKSDAKAEWVSTDIKITLNLTATANNAK